MPRLRFSGGIALLAAVVTGCGVALPPEDEPDDVTVPAEPTMLNIVDPATVPGLGTRTAGSDQQRPHVHTAYPTFAGAPALNAWLARDAAQAITRFKGEHLDWNSFPAPELNVDWQLTAVSSKAIGVRLRTGRFSGATWSSSYRTVWYVRSTGQVRTSAELVEDLSGLADAVRDRLKDEAGVDISAITPRPDLFDSLDFNSRGDLVAEFDDYQVAPGSAGRVAVAIPADKAAGLLTSFGRDAQEASKTRAAFPQMTTAKLPEAVSLKHGGVDCTATPCVALTFDDGPGPDTPRVLDLLRERQVRATFFVVGQDAAAHPDLLRRMRDEGHLIANHTWSHQDLTTLPGSRTYDQITRAQEAIGAVVGQTPTLLRPPYGAIDPDVAEVAAELGMAIVQWNAEAGESVEHFRPGSVILLRGSKDVPAVVDALAARGYAFVTVPELLGGRTVQPGRTYESGMTPARPPQP
ncbi:polysaccharide deacetylase family protein [Streptosporangiaceae bacterium NEAU-GS5]|nr:polysaccharide deacetylase family protein [Streptosporangiaceae bacterium NEAU-GS5]